MTAGRTTRAERMAAPLARQVVKELAAEHGACLRPVQLRRTEIDTGHVEQVLIPCGHTLASVCPSCAERARILRAAQCREGWHLDHEPSLSNFLCKPGQSLSFCYITVDSFRCPGQTGTRLGNVTANAFMAAFQPGLRPKYCRCSRGCDEPGDGGEQVFVVFGFADGGGGAVEAVPVA